MCQKERHVDARLYTCQYSHSEGFLGQLIIRGSHCGLQRASTRANNSGDVSMDGRMQYADTRCIKIRCLSQKVRSEVEAKHVTVLRG